MLVSVMVPGMTPMIVMCLVIRENGHPSPTAMAALLPPVMSLTKETNRRHRDPPVGLTMWAKSHIMLLMAIGELPRKMVPLCSAILHAALLTPPGRLPLRVVHMLCPLSGRTLARFLTAR